MNEDCRSRAVCQGSPKNTIIRNYATLAVSEERKKVLDIITAGLEAIQPAAALAERFTLSGQTLHIHGTSINLGDYPRVFLLGIGKGAAGICRYIEDVLGAYLTEGHVIDVVAGNLRRCHYTVGTHPLPSSVNLVFTQDVLKRLSGLSAHDLVLVVICGGGSAIFEAPARVDLDTLIAVNTALLRSGATISEINTVRKHLSMVKGGGLAKALYPAKVMGLIFSDVPGNDLSVIASGPTVKDLTTLQDAQAVMARYSLYQAVPLSPDDFIETVREERYFTRVTNTIMISNLTALKAMEAAARCFSLCPVLHSDRLQGEAKIVGRQLLSLTEPGQVLLAGGETTVKVQGHGRGGRNQALVLAALPYVGDHAIIASVDSDGLDFHHFAGAIGDRHTAASAVRLNLDPDYYLADDNAFEFFSMVGDGIFTDKLDSNVADLMVVYKQ